MAVPALRKHPSRVLALPIDIINSGSNTISSSSSSSSPSGLTITTTNDNTLKRVTLLISGGSNGTTYRVTTLITMSNGEVAVDLVDIIVDVDSDQ